MKNVLNILFLVPLLLYLIILLLNISVLGEPVEINLFWLTKVKLSFSIVSSFFFIVYFIIMYGLFRFSKFFITNKNKKLLDEINGLKAKIADGQEELITKVINQIKTENNSKLEAYKKEHSKVVDTINYELKTIKKKLDTISKN